MVVATLCLKHAVCGVPTLCPSRPQAAAAGRSTLPSSGVDSNERGVSEISTIAAALFLTCFAQTVS